MTKYCAIVPKEDKENKRVGSALVTTSVKMGRECQFDNLPAEYEHNGEDFCILHLPLQTKKKLNLSIDSNEEFLTQLRSGKRIFDFVTLENIKIENINEKELCLSFVGSQLWSISIKDVNVPGINFDYAKINGHVNFESCIFKDKWNFATVSIKNSEVDARLNFNNIQLDYLRISGNSFKSSINNELRLDHYNHGIIIKNTTIENSFSFENNDCESGLEIASTSINQLYLDGTTFYQSPIITLDDANKIKKLSFPLEKEFNLNRLDNCYRKKSDVVWDDQYKKFRDLYNIAKKRDMYIEQGCFYSLMQRCREKSGSTPFGIRFVSWFYRFFSNYGQSIFKPLLCLLVLWAMGVVLFLWCGISLEKALMLSIKQIVKPYSLLCEYGYTQLCQFISIFESTAAIAFIAMLLLALRWNFRKS